MSFYHVYLGPLVLLVSPSLSPVALKIDFFSSAFLQILHKEFDRDIPFRDVYSKISPCLHTLWMWISIFFQSTAKQSFSDESWTWDWSMSLALVQYHCIFSFYFCNLYYLVLPYIPLLSSLRVLVTQAVAGISSVSGVGVLNQIISNKSIVWM